MPTSQNWEAIITIIRWLASLEEQAEDSDNHRMPQVCGSTQENILQQQVAAYKP